MKHEQEILADPESTLPERFEAYLWSLIDKAVNWFPLPVEPKETGVFNEDKPKNTILAE